jgi:opacity protein-like surface antigen
VIRRPVEAAPAVPSSHRGVIWVSLTAALLVTLASSVADAQWASPRGWHRFSLGAGPAEALSPLSPERRDGAAAMVAFEVVAREHLEVRFSGTLFEGNDDPETQLGGVALDAVVFPWRGWLQPYAGAGVGAYQLIVEDGDPLAVDRRRDAKSLAWTALVGARLRVGSLTPFVEWRRTEFDTDVPMTRYAPLLFGLHF